jgi:Ni/Fe-hydrogenase subunit HybB-like protein
MAILFSPRIRSNKKGLFSAALLTVLGFIFNRLNIAITSIERSAGVEYFPSWTEISVSLMIVALGFAVFRFAVKYLPILPERHETKQIKEPAVKDIVSFINVPTH